MPCMMSSARVDSDAMVHDALVGAFGSCFSTNGDKEIERSAILSEG